MSDPAIWTFLGMSVLVIGLAFVSIRFVGTWQLRQVKGRKLRVLEGVSIGRDRQLLLVAVGKEILVLGSSPAGVNLVHRLPDEEVTELLHVPHSTMEASSHSSSVPQPAPVLESSIRTSLDKLRGLLKKDAGDRSDTWGPL